MSDFRSDLYKSYVSTATRLSAQSNRTVLEIYLDWCAYKFPPLLEHLRGDDRILELGCGPGHMLEFLRRQGFSRVEGIDVSGEQVALARNQGRNAQVADVFEYLIGKENTFDAILALDFVEHFHKDELAGLMSLIYKSLKKGGTLILQTPNGEGLFPHQVIYGDLTHLTIFTHRSLTQLLLNSGFCHAQFIETGPVPKGIVGRLRLWAWRVIRMAANLARRIETGKTQSLWTENMICSSRKPA